MSPYYTSNSKTAKLAKFRIQVYIESLHWYLKEIENV